MTKIIDGHSFVRNLQTINNTLVKSAEFDKIYVHNIIQEKVSDTDGSEVDAVFAVLRHPGSESDIMKVAYCDIHVDEETIKSGLYTWSDIGIAFYILNDDELEKTYIGVYIECLNNLIINLSHNFNVSRRVAE